MAQLEIIELPNGEFVLKNPEQEDQPVVSIRFSDQSREFAGDNCLEIARVMIHAGLQTAAHMAGAEVREEHLDDGESSEIHSQTVIERILH